MEEAIVIGQLRRMSKLGSDAVYLVRAVAAELIELEVVYAPKLAPGQVVRFTRAAVSEMTPVAEAPRGEAGASGPGTLGSVPSNESTLGT